jgi:hypothetical protein
MKSYARALAALAVLMCAPVANATLIQYSATSLGDSSWRYEYSVTNDTLADPLTYFVIDFDISLYANLRDQSGPEGWDILLLQSDPLIPAGGVFDALALDGGIGLGSTLAGFALTFDFFGPGLPGSQPFTVLDFGSFEPVESGVAVDVLPARVPEPATFALFLSGLLLLTGMRRFRPN